MEDKEKKPPYYRIITERHNIIEKAEEALLKRANAYEMEHKVLHRSYAVAVQGNGWAVSILFCCETEPGETY